MTSQHTPADDAARSQSAQPTEPTRPTEQIRPVEQTRPADHAQPEGGTRPMPPVPASPTVAQPQQPTYQPHQHSTGQHGAQQHGAGQHSYAQQAHDQSSQQPQQQPFVSAFRQEPQQGSTAVAAAAPKRRLVLPIATTAVLAAVLASVGTAALTGQIGADGSTGTTTSSAYGSIGQKGDSSVAVPVAESTDGSADWKAVSAAVAPSVVAIKVTTAEGQGEGSGVVIDAQGHILTNDHVVSGADDDTVQVTFADGRVYDAKIVGLDPATDLAVVQLVDPPDDLQAAVFADSAVTVGDAVMAVGNPLGLANTATTGIVSAVDRPVSTATSNSNQAPVVTNAIQIDAAINPGNSGGPLFNSQGEVIGITSSIASLSSSGTSSQSGSIGLGFAIPVSLAQNIGSQLIENGTAEHAFLGVTLGDGTGTAEGTTRQGAVVGTVSDGSPASEAGLRADDVVVAIDGKTVTGAESLTGFVRGMASGTEVTLTVVRDGKALDVPVTLATKTEDATSNDQGSDGTAPDQGSGGTAPGQGTLPGSESPNNVPDFSDLFPGQNG